MKIRSEDVVPYAVEASEESENEVIRQALNILSARLARSTNVMSSPEVVKQYLAVRLAELPHEVFGIIYLDATGRLISDCTLFRGTVTQASAYPREVVKEALKYNAVGCILYHNHPSGAVEPSRADEMLTRAMKDALALVDVAVRDHIIIGATNSFSFAERGLI